MGILTAADTQRFHDEAMAAGAESMRVQYEAVPRRSKKAKLAIGACTLFAIVGIGVLIAL
jgi:hypothetical protein